MSQTYVCTDKKCPDEYLDSLGEVIDHLRGTHRIIQRPHALGVPDSHGHIWYCFCFGQLSQYHKSFNSHRAMWDHLNSKHDDCLDYIRLGSAYEEDQAYRAVYGL